MLLRTPMITPAAQMAQVTWKLIGLSNALLFMEWKV
jgi:hypothetical protein